MSEYSLDINQTGKTQAADQPWKLPSKKEETGKDNSTLTFDDMLMLMVTQMQNQTIDNQMDTSDMMNQLIQMTVMQALTDMTTQVEDLTNANIMSYSASLVGKEVTVGVLDSKGALAEEIVGTVTATGTYNGQQVIFLGDRYYPLSSIMSVGRLPDEAIDGNNPTEPADPDGDDKTEGDDKVDGSEGSGGEGTGSGDTQAPSEDQTPEAATLGLRDNTAAASRSTIPSGAYTPQSSAQSAAVQDSGAAARSTIPSGVYTPQPAASQSTAVQKNEATAQARNEEESGAAPWLFENGSPSAQSEEESGIPSWLLTQSEQAVAGGVPSWLVGPET